MICHTQMVRDPRHDRGEWGTPGWGRAWRHWDTGELEWFAEGYPGYGESEECEQRVRRLMAAERSNRELLARSEKGRELVPETITE